MYKLSGCPVGHAVTLSGWDSRPPSLCLTAVNCCLIHTTVCLNDLHETTAARLLSQKTPQVSASMAVRTGTQPRLLLPSPSVSSHASVFLAMQVLSSSPLFSWGIPVYPILTLVWFSVQQTFIAIFSQTVLGAMTVIKIIFALNILIIFVNLLEGGTCHCGSQVRE